MCYVAVTKQWRSVVLPRVRLTVKMACLVRTVKFDLHCW